MRWVFERVSGGVSSRPAPVHQRPVVGGQAFELVSVGQGHAQPKAGGARPNGKPLLQQPLRVGLSPAGKSRT